MTLHSIKSALLSHGVPVQIKETKILAFDGDEFTDVTNFNRDQLMSWLGYDEQDED